MTNSITHSKLFYTLFSPEKEIKATLLIIHGMQEHSGRYAEIAEYFASRGIVVLTYDHIGHGKSINEKKDLGFFHSRQPAEKLINDAEKMSQYISDQYKNVPHFILGHSMGSFITRCVLQKNSPKLAGAIITGTGGSMTGIGLLKGYFSLANAVASHKRTLFNRLFNFVNNRHFKRDKDYSSTSWLSVSTANRNSFSQDELCGIPFTNNAYYALFSIYKQATSRHWAKDISTSFPFLFISGEDDPIGDFGKGVQQTVQHLVKDGFKKVRLQLYPEMRHEILNEEIREEILQEISDWIMENL
ncbi:alpha/beta fold hydrolase [Chryseobacterium sp. CT-SW4]|uniref:alpha/beta fold hydrolase n=1 Tax=Chryseobacterium sp. SW-1 TaxID=3157343 RepID=UPI003B02B143